MICYDVRDDTKRRNVRKILEGYGERVQFSVFECNLSDSQHAHLRKELTPFIDPASDSFRFYPLCSGCYPKTFSLGAWTGQDDEGYELV
jgi:CRISPR-associated protein Cas2